MLPLWVAYRTRVVWRRLYAELRRWVMRRVITTNDDLAEVDAYLDYWYQVTE